MAPPFLLFSSYQAEMSFDFKISNLTLPGISVPGKVLLARMSDDLVILILGIIGHEEPIFSIADFSKIATEVDASTLSLIMHFVDLTVPGALCQIGPGIFQTCQPSVHLRIGFHNQAAFWAFSFLIAQSGSHRTVDPVLAPSVADHHNILRILDFFKSDHGPEIAMGGEVLSVDANAPPGYMGKGDLLDFFGNLLMR